MASSSPSRLGTVLRPTARRQIGRRGGRDHATSRQLARHQGALTTDVGAVELMDFLRLVVDIKSRAHLWIQQHVERLRAVLLALQVSLW